MEIQFITFMILFVYLIFKELKKKLYLFSLNDKLLFIMEQFIKKLLIYYFRLIAWI